MTPADFAELAVLGTAWLAMACYFLGAFLLLQIQRRTPALSRHTLDLGDWMRFLFLARDRRVSFCA